MSDSTPHGSHAPADGPAVGQDEWVARHAERRIMPSGPLGTIEDRIRARAVVGVARPLPRGASTLPACLEPSGYVRRVAFDTVLYMLLALGLNVVVGWGGLLDLGYVAFYGIGAYTYAMLDSRQVRDPPADDRRRCRSIVAIGAMVGFLLGLPSRRLTGDYLAIVTLFFLQLFQTITTNGDDAFGHNVTGGPNGILQHRSVPPRQARSRRRSTRASSRSRTSTSRSRSSRSSSSRSGSSTTRAPAAPGARCARIRWPPR